MMDFLASDGFASVFPFVVALAGLYWALRADIGRRIDKLEDRLGQRIDKTEATLRQQIDKGDEALGQRIDRQEERTRASHKELVGKIGEVVWKIGELVGEIAKLKAAVSAINAKLDERSSPRPLQVREPGADYPVGDDSAGSPDNPEDDPADVPGGAAEGDSAT